MQIFDSVHAILKKELSQYLKKDTFIKLENKIKSYREPIGVFHSETGDTTIIGSLKAVLLCQQHLIAFLRSLKTKNAYSVVLKEENEGVEKLDISLLSYSACTKNRNSILQEVKIQSKEPEIHKFSSCGKELSNPKRMECSETKKMQKEVPIQQSNTNDLICKSDNMVFERGTTTAHEYTQISLSDNREIMALTTAETLHMKYSCSLCPFRSLKKSLFLKHQTYHEKLLKKSNSPQEFCCNDCGENFDLSSDYEKHLLQSGHDKKEEQISSNTNAVKDEKNFLCKICGFGARRRREYKNHIESSHPTTYSCPQCEYKTCRKVHYLRHVRNVHDNKRPFVCKTCGVAFKRRDALKQHQVIHIRNSKTRTPFQCEVCSKVVRSAPYLREHMLTHSDERSFLCEICGASFKTRPVHRNHMKVVHSQSLQAACKYCSKTFATKYSLSRHIRQHGNRKSEDWSHPLLETNVTSSNTEDTKPTSIVTTMSKACNDKTIDSIYTDFSSSDNFSISIDNQIPYIIHSTQEVTTE